MNTPVLDEEALLEIVDLSVDELFALLPEVVMGFSLLRTPLLAFNCCPAA